MNAFKIKTVYNSFLVQPLACNVHTEGLKLSQWKFSSEHLSDVKKGRERVLIWDFGASTTIKCLQSLVFLNQLVVFWDQSACDNCMHVFLLSFESLSFAQSFSKLWKFLEIFDTLGDIVSSLPRALFYFETCGEEIYL